MAEVLIGKISDYFAKIGVAALTITDGELRAGDTIHITGHTTDLEQKVNSMQSEHETIEVAKTGVGVGIKVKERVRDGDKVYKVID
ncbi:MAG: translation elongation factor-like protein [Candidatus Caldatribacteriota bacterium]|nr:translation elongation factor-like protein [Candidatus Caldatribacteriota bacterium]